MKEREQVRREDIWVNISAKKIASAKVLRQECADVLRDNVEAWTIAQGQG